MSLNIEIGDKKATVFLNKDEIETETLKQIKAMIKEEGIINARIMPDCHKSKNCCVGFTSKLIDKIVPNYVGNDIGCGIVTYQINMEKSINSIRQKLLDKIIKDIDVNIAFQSYNYKAMLLDYTYASFKSPIDRIFDLSNTEVQKFKKYYLEKIGTDVSSKIPI